MSVTIESRFYFAAFEVRSQHRLVLNVKSVTSRLVCKESLGCRSKGCGGVGKGGSYGDGRTDSEW